MMSDPEAIVNKTGGRLNTTTDELVAKPSGDKNSSR